MAESDISTDEIVMKRESLVDAEPKSKPTALQSPAAAPGNISVVVIGATGVTGRYVVAELLLCPEISSVRIVTRNKYDIPREYANSVIVSNAAQEGKLVEHILDMEKVSDEELRNIFEGVHTFFNCLGSTRSRAGSKERFIQIDMNIPVRFAQIAREKGVKHTSLLTSSGANDKSFVFYFKVKGLIESSFRNLEFPALSIFRPGLLGRKEQMKFSEKMYSLFQSPLQTDDLARGMVQDSLNIIRRVDTPLNPLYTNPQIKALNAERLKELRLLNNPSLENPEYNEDDKGVVTPIVMVFSNERNESANLTKDSPILSVIGVAPGEGNSAVKTIDNSIPTATESPIIDNNSNIDGNVSTKEVDRANEQIESVPRQYMKPGIEVEVIATTVEPITITEPIRPIESITESTEPIIETTRPITESTEHIPPTTELIIEATKPISRTIEPGTDNNVSIIDTPESNSEDSKEKETDTLISPDDSFKPDPDLTPTPNSPDSTPATEQAISPNSDKLLPENVTLPECDISNDPNFSSGDTDVTSPSIKPNTTSSSFQTANSSDISDPMTPKASDTNS